MLKGIDESKIKVHENGSNIEKFKPQPKNMELLNGLGINGQIVVGYIGTHGMAHNLEFIVKSIANIQNKQLTFLFIGDGATKEDIVAHAQKLNLGNIIFHPPVSKDEIKDYLSLIDIALVPLIRADTFKTQCF